LGKIYSQIHKGNENIIVMGDHINDLDTIKNIKYLNEIKIGFINYKEDTLTEQQIKLKDAFQLHYDVCIVNDGNLSFVNNLIKDIEENKLI
jgi:hypothetical protein